MLRPFFPELVISTDLLSFEHPSVLLFCFLKRVHKHNVFLYTCCICFVYVMFIFGTSYIILKFLFLFFAIPVCIHYMTMNRSLHSSLSYLHWITFKLFNDYYSTNKVLGLFRNNYVCLSVCLSVCSSVQIVSGPFLLIPLQDVFHTIVVHDQRMCHDLDSRSYLQGQNHSKHVPQTNVRVTTL